MKEKVITHYVVGTTNLDALNDTAATKVWRLIGVYDCIILAKAQCKRDNFFVAPADLNKTYPENLSSWEGLEFPNFKIYDETKKYNGTNAGKLGSING